MKSKIVGVTPLDPDSSIPVIPFADLPALYNPVRVSPTPNFLLITEAAVSHWLLPVCYFILSQGNFFK